MLFSSFSAPLLLYLVDQRAFTNIRLLSASIEGETNNAPGILGMTSSPAAPLSSVSPGVNQQYPTNSGEITPFSTSHPLGSLETILVITSLSHSPFTFFADSTAYLPVGPESEVQVTEASPSM